MAQRSKSKQLKVAITGNIGSGKTTFSKYINDLGYPVINSDNISKEILSNDSSVREAIIKAFGARSFQGKEINTKYLAELVFTEPNNLKRINSILHPHVWVKIEESINELYYSSTIVFVESALIYEAKFAKMFDFVVLITAEKSIRMKRYSSGKQSSEEDFIQREKNQSPQEQKAHKADFVFSNNGSMIELKSKAGLLIKVLEAYTN